MTMRFRRTFTLASLVFCLPVAAIAQQTTGTLGGAVHTEAGAPIAVARVAISGPRDAVAMTDAKGGFSFVQLPAGYYRVTVQKGGFLPASLPNVTIFAGEAQELDVVLVQPSLSSLQTIARVTGSGASRINVGAAASAFESRDAILDLANPSINAVIARIPGSVVTHGSSSPNTSLSLAGSQTYETQVLLDGHPLSAGRYGVWFSQFFNSFLLSGIETQQGPGNTTPFAGTAVGGTANLVTLGFRVKPSFEYVEGVDSFNAQNAGTIFTGSQGKLDYAVGGYYNSYNGPYQNQTGCVFNPATKNTWGTAGATGIISFCGSLAGPLGSRGEIAKLRLHLSAVTSFEAGFIGSQGGYNPQGSAYGIFGGSVPVQGCLPNKNAGINGQICTDPQYKNNVGSSQSAYFFYPGSVVNNNQPIFTGELRTVLGNDTILIRPYLGSITRSINGSGEANYAQFYYPSTLGNAYCTGNAKNPAATSGYGGIVGPITVASPYASAPGTLTQCLESPFSLLEQDKLSGNTLSYIKTVRNGSLTATYDFHNDETFAYYGTPSAVAVPDTTARFTTLSLVGQLSLSRTVTLAAGGYYSIWGLNGSQTGTVSSSGATTIPLNRNVGVFDPHIALTLAPKPGQSYRVSFGTSTTFPYAAQVSGNSSYTPPSGSGSGVGVLTQKNATLAPERATEFDLGFDRRLHSGGVISVDILSNSVSNVFETITSPVSGNAQYGFVNQPVNAASLSSLFAMLSYSYQPKSGVGFYATATAARSVVNGLPLNFYPAAAFALPANGVQQCSDGGSNACVPYLKGYGRVNYTLKNGARFGLGVDFEGKNNTYFQPPFAVYDFSARYPVSKRIDLSLGIENLLNTNSFAGLVQPNAGVSLIGENASGQYGAYAGGILYPRVPAAPRTLRLQLRFHVGR